MFLEDNYEPPTSNGSSGKYLNPSKLPDGEAYKLRVMSETALKGWEYWSTDGKPKRLPFDASKPNGGQPSTPSDIRIGDDGKPERIRHFWAFVVWDYQAKSLKIMSITQNSIQKAIVNLFRDEDWGHPKEYDIKITRTGQKLETEYSVVPAGGKKPIPDEAVQELAAHPINLNALLTGEDPFKRDPVMEITTLANELKLQAAEVKNIREQLQFPKTENLSDDQLDTLKDEMKTLAYLKAEAAKGGVASDDEVDF